MSWRWPSSTFFSFSQTNIFYSFGHFLPCQNSLSFSSYCRKWHLSYYPIYTNLRRYPTLNITWDLLENQITPREKSLDMKLYHLEVERVRLGSYRGVHSAFVSIIKASFRFLHLFLVRIFFGEFFLGLSFDVLARFLISAQKSSADFAFMDVIKLRGVCVYDCIDEAVV